MDGYGKRVLILDDNEDIRHVTGVALTNRRYNVYAAADGSEGLEEMTKRRYDVVLVDYSMPRVNGLQFIEMSHKTWPRTPIILMSADVRISDERMRPVGAYACIAKPFAISELLALISDACRGRDVFAAAPMGSAA
ncbi:MAG: response regulator [Nitrospira sp.]